MGKTITLNRWKESDKMRALLQDVDNGFRSKLTKFENGFIESVAYREDYNMSQKQWTVAKRIVKHYLHITVKDEVERPKSDG